MYRLFQRIPRGLDPVADIFKKHVESEGMKLVKEVTEAMNSKKDKDAGARRCLLLWGLQPGCQPIVPISKRDVNSTIP